LTEFIDKTSTTPPIKPFKKFWICKQGAQY
jgi:hypothetical protein